MAKKFAPLKVANPTEVRQDWNAVMRELPLLAEWIERTFAVDISDLTTEYNLIVSPDEPKGNNAQALWIKNTSPPGIGIPFGSSYTMVYPYPLDVPFLWIKGTASLPLYLRKLTETELTDYALTDPDSEDHFYAILEL